MEDFKNRVNETKKKINEAKLSKEFKDNLKIIMDKEYYKTTNENSKVRLVENKNSTFKNTKLKLLYPKKIAAIFLCFIIISSLTFVGDWENFFAKIFYNMDESMSLAIEEGYIQNIDMDYVECNGIKIKVDYILFDEQRLYIAFNVNTEKEFDDIFLNGFFIKDENENVIYDSYKENYSMSFSTDCEKIGKKNFMVLNKFNINDSNTKFKFNFNKINIIIKKVYLKDKEGLKSVIGNWSIRLENVRKANLTNSTSEYWLDTANIIEDYEIKKINSNLNISLKLIDKKFLISKNNIFIEDNTGKRYYISDGYKYDGEYFRFTIPIDTENLEELKLVLNYLEEKVIFNLKDKGNG